LGRGCLSSSRLGRGPGAVDFVRELLDLASQQGKGHIKGGAEEPKLLLGEGRGSGGGLGGGGGAKRESLHDGAVAQLSQGSVHTLGKEQSDSLRGPYHLSALALNVMGSVSKDVGEGMQRIKRIRHRDGGGKRKRMWILAFPRFL